MFCYLFVSSVLFAKLNTNEPAACPPTPCLKLECFGYHYNKHI